MRNSKPTLFVAMPFKDELNNVLFVIRSIGKQHNYHIHRADDGKACRVILDEIIDSIVTSDVVIADITYSNPNVFLEIGYAWAIGKEVLLISSDIKNVPFDVRNHRVIDYGDPSNAAEIETVLLPIIEEAVNRSGESANLTKPVLEIVKKINDHKRDNYLYNKIIESYISKVTDDVDLWLNGALDADKYELITTGMVILKHIEKGGFITYFAPIDEFWSENDDYFNECRLVSTDSKRNLFLQRVYILDNFKSILSSNLQTNIRKDEASNIETFVVFRSDINNDAIRDFGIWDESVVCMMDAQYDSNNEYEVRGATFSKNNNDINRYILYKNDLINHAINGSILINDIDNLDSEKKLLLESIFQMNEISNLYCEGSYLATNDCNWYHGAWQYLRLIGLVSTPKWHENFYQNSLDTSLHKCEKAVVLISGTADYGILEQLYNTRCINNISDVTVMDICESPLKICRWYHEKFGPSDVNFNAVKRDIMNNMTAENSQDIIITDAFLSRFSRDKRVTIVNQWFRILKPGGHVITTLRVEETLSGKITSSKNDVQKFIKRSESHIRRVGTIFSYLNDKIISKAKNYAENITSSPVNNTEEIQELFSSFENSIATSTITGEINNETTYARIIAKKPNK
jgi:ubiquinone/menaquinone biosynthesis C-methylase UbiE